MPIYLTSDEWEVKVLLIVIGGEVRSLIKKVTKQDFD